MKNPLLVVSLVFLLCFAFGCQNKAEKAQLEKFKAQGKLEEQKKGVVGNFFAAIDKNDFDKLKQLSADGFSFREPGMAEPIGFETLVQVIKTHYAAFPDWKHTIEEMIAEGNIVAIRLVQNGTHKAPYEGIPPTNKEVTMQALFFCEVVDGRVKGGWAIEDYLGLYQELGMELKPKEVKK